MRSPYPHPVGREAAAADLVLVAVADLALVAYQHSHHFNNIRVPRNYRSYQNNFHPSFTVPPTMLASPRPPSEIGNH